MKSFALAVVVVCGFATSSYAQTQCGSPPCKTVPAYRVVYPTQPLAPAVPKTGKLSSMPVIAGLPAAIVNYPTEANLLSLVRAFRESNGDSRVAAALIKLGEPAAPFLAETIADTSARVRARRMAAEAVGKIGPPAKVALEPLQVLIEESGDKDGIWKIMKSIALVSTAAIKDDVPTMVRLVRERRNHPLLRAILRATAQRKNQTYEAIIATENAMPGIQTQ